MALIMGMNSGSSFDGIDVILAETEIADDGFPAPPKFLKGGSYDWPQKVRDLIEPAFYNKVDMPGLMRLNYIAGAAMAEAVRAFVNENSIDVKEIAVLGVDGQTIYQEQPDHERLSKMTNMEKDDWVGRWLDGPYPCGYQIGDTSVIAGLTDITTVTNFRQADHTQGGNAAPLMQYLDFVLFRKESHPVMTLNIGGIANVHYACGDRREMVAFDTGPGNLVSNIFATYLYDLPCDYNGEHALAGKVNEMMLADFKDHPFFKRPVPRSGWKIDFSEDYCKEMLNKYASLSNEDKLATACAFTAEAIVRSMHDYISHEKLSKADVLYASGGGVRNKAIMKCLQEKLPHGIRLASSDEIGIPPEYKEAVKFATLAYSAINGIANNIPAASHADKYTVQGKISIAPWRARNIGSL